MVRNNIEIDVKVKCIEEGTTQAGSGGGADRDHQVICEPRHQETKRSGKQYVCADDGGTGV